MDGLDGEDGDGMALTEGMSASLLFDVAVEDTARVVGSGDLDVLATPRLLAWLEAATCAAVSTGLEAGQTTVGTRVSIEHRRASGVGDRLTVRAVIVGVEGTLLTFEAEATDQASGAVVGVATVTRAVVDRDRFLSRLGRRG